MLISLYIRDFALIDELEIGFSAGLNVITGQTGAGKSILIGALNMVLGGRADTEVIRTGAAKAIAEAVFKLQPENPVQALLKAHDIETAETLVVRREIRPTGSRAFINDSPVSVNLLKEAGEFLVDLHGQHDHQLLLREEHHRPFLDGFPDVLPVLGAYQVVYREVEKLSKEREKLLADRKVFSDKLELYRLHANELKEAALEPDEEQFLRSEMNLLDSAEDLIKTTESILNAGSEGEFNSLSQLKTIASGLNRLTAFEPSFASFAEEVHAAVISLSETLNQVERFKNRLSFNPQRLETIRERLSLLKSLQRRFNRTIPELLVYRDEIEAFLAAGDSFEDRLAGIDTRIEQAQQQLNSAAGRLLEVRKNRAIKLSASVCAVLAEVGINHAVFEVDFVETESKSGWIFRNGKRIEATAAGGETVRFLISTNRGESPKPLARIASGGEISRVMLALKSIVAREQSLPVMVFDEIDTGISGAVSEKVGRLMRQLSRTCQILTITHQSQIACQGDTHLRVEKTDSGDRTVTRIIALSFEDQVEELARLSSGEVITAAALENARHMIERARIQSA